MWAEKWRDWFSGAQRGGDPIIAVTHPHEQQAAEAQLRFLLEYGGLAPAMGAHGAPPWLFRMHDDAIDVVLAHRCARDLFDPAHRELVIACGAAISQLRLSMRQLGFGESLVRFPDPAQRALVARVYIDEFEPASPEAYVLYQAMRAPLVQAEAMRGLDASLLQEIKAVCEQERVHLRYVDRSILAASERVHAVDTAAMCDVPDVEESIALLHPFHSETFRPENDSWSGRNAPALAHTVGAVVTTKSDEPADWIAAGQALSRAMLRARVDGVCGVSHGIAPSIRYDLATSLRGEHPQVVVRFGYPRSGNFVRHETKMFEAVRR